MSLRDTPKDESDPSPDLILRPPSPLGRGKKFVPIPLRRGAGGGHAPPGEGSLFGAGSRYGCFLRYGLRCSARDAGWCGRRVSDKLSGTINQPSLPNPSIKFLTLVAHMSHHRIEAIVLALTGAARAYASGPQFMAGQ